MSFIDRLRARLTLTDANWREQDRFDSRILGPWIAWSVTDTENPVGVTVLTWTSSAGAAPVVGNGDLSGAWRELGDVVSIRLQLTIGSTTTNAGGRWIFSLPFPCAVDLHATFPGVYHSATAGNRIVVCGLSSNVTQDIAQVDTTGGSLDNTTAIAAGDLLVLAGFYRPA